MLFNSFAFLVFVVVVFVAYWFILKGSRKGQNFLLLAASYLFYGWWDWRFLFLLAFSTALDFYTGLRIHSAQSRRSKNVWRWLSISVNLGFLGFFKYYNFFAASFAEAAGQIGLHIDPWTLQIILPVGISFYTFHGLSYILDIFYDRIKPEKDFIDYAVFVSFFPLLVAGPIERATHLLPQIKSNREFKFGEGLNGLIFIFWGLFKKMVIADNCSVLVNRIFETHQEQSSITLVMGTVLFAFQIYCDFSGYSDIALGTAKLFGISLLRNFAYPYFSRDIAEFWRRWHISLTTWFRDYVYIPMGGSQGTVGMQMKNIMIIFLISGFWHGANWTFIFWGFLNAVYFMPLLLLKANRRNLDSVAKDRILPTLREALQIAATFSLTCIAWIFFRCKTLHDSFLYLKDIFTNGSMPSKPMDIPEGVYWIPVLIVVEWTFRRFEMPFWSWADRSKWIVVFCLLMVITIFRYIGDSVEFIYFQF